MDGYQLETGQVVFDPRGTLETESKPIAPRVPSLSGLRLGALDNTKWNGGKLLRKTIDLLRQEVEFAGVHYYKKESFSRNAAPKLIEQIVMENDVVITAIGD